MAHISLPVHREGGSTKSAAAGGTLCADERSANMRRLSETESWREVLNRGRVKCQLIPRPSQRWKVQRTLLTPLLKTYSVVQRKTVILQS